MAVINRRLQLRDINSNLVFPRASLDNLQRSKNDGRDALVVTLNDSGRIDAALLPDSSEFVVMLRTAANAAPLSPAAGDRYYNISQNKIYTYANSSWGTGATPDVTKLYVTTDTNNIYRYDSSSSQMDEVSVSFTVVDSVNLVPSSASATAVPSERAVSVALQGKQDSVSGSNPINVAANGTISLKYTTGLSLSGGSLTVPASYVTDTIDASMFRDATAASQEVVYTNGGNAYTLVPCPLPPAGGTGVVVLSYNYSTGTYSWVAR